MSISDRDVESYSSEVRLFLELDSGRRISVAQLGAGSLIVRDDEGEYLASRMARLIVVVDGEPRDSEVLLTKYDQERGVVEFV